jgi:hypothetical protein
LTPNPILKVLSVLNKYKVKYLLIGGQACIIYGAAEFSRDSDFVILSATDNLARMRKALKAMKAKPIYVPILNEKYLDIGHACHFRCGVIDVQGLRIDVMARLRGCDEFSVLWGRRKRLSLKTGGTLNVISLQDLVSSKKTQRDKDWLMLKRLVNNDIILKKYKAAPDRIKWWLGECRNVDILVELAKRYHSLAKEVVKDRPLVASAIKDDKDELFIKLNKEEARERKKDIAYWLPLKKELETLRHKILQKSA